MHTLTHNTSTLTHTHMPTQFHKHTHTHANHCASTFVNQIRLSIQTLLCFHSYIKRSRIIYPVTLCSKPLHTTQDRTILHVYACIISSWISNISTSSVFTSHKDTPPCRKKATTCCSFKIEFTQCSSSIGYQSFFVCSLCP